MSKSQETWNKKEREKKKQKSRQDKQEKKLERKEQNKEGKSFDDMMAYIDEDGNLSSTPPDPRKKKIVKREDMQISTPRQAPVDPSEAFRSGTITHFNDAKGYGFIRDSQTQESIFVHINAID